MAKKIELLMPKMGESIQEATILKWVKSAGDTVDVDDPILEIATDKVDSDVPSPVSGKIVETLYDEDEVVEVGKAVAIIETEDDVDDDIPVVDGGDSESSSSEQKEEKKEKVEEPATASESKTEATAEKTDLSGGSRFYSPLVLNIAKTEGIGMDELEQIEGSGKEGRVTKKDMLQYVGDKKAGKVEKPQPKQEAASSQKAGSLKSSAPQTSGKEVDVPLGEGDEIIEMDRMRKMIADHMVRSKHTSPHVTSMVEVDMTKVVNWRNKVKKSFQEREGEKITFTPIFVEAVTQAIKEMRGINISVAGDKIIKRKHINIGMATALPNGNLIVPVIKDADNLSLVGLAKTVNNLASRARENKLSPDEIQGGTFTITNVGTFGNVMGTPVINQPQVAIMAVGAIQKKPAVIETPEGDVIGIRHKMFLSMSYDHRVVDGSLGGAFIRKVADVLEDWDPDRSI